MNEAQLASVFYVVLMKEFPKEDANTKLWEVAKKLSRMAQPKKKFQDLYNSPEARKERRKI